MPKGERITIRSGTAGAVTASVIPIGSSRTVDGPFRPDEAAAGSSTVRRKPRASEIVRCVHQPAVGRASPSM